MTGSRRRPVDRVSPHAASAAAGHGPAADATPDLEGPAGHRSRSRPSRLEVTLVATLVALAALFTAGLVGYGLPGRSSDPGDNSAEAGFARDMQTHHAQAVQMALTIRDKTADPTIRTVAYDIVTSQQQQSGQMFAWLTLWDLPQTGSQPAMAWMSTGGRAMSGMATDAGATAATPRTSPAGTGAAGNGAPSTMPGMASADDLKRLEAAKGVEAERLFLQLMIVHHRGGIQMAQAVLERTTRREVVTLAQAIQTAQTAEIEQMTTLLKARSA